MFQNQDLRRIFGLKPQDLQYLFVGRFIEPSSTLSKGPRGRRVCDLHRAFLVGIFSALRTYRMDFRVGHIVTQGFCHLVTRQWHQSPRCSNIGQTLRYSSHTRHLYRIVG